MAAPRRSCLVAPIGTALNELIVIHSLRSDRLMASAHRLVSTAFGESFMQQDKVIDMKEIIENEVSSSDPVLLCSATGYDASNKIEDLGVDTNRQVTSIAIGSAEGFSQAESVIYLLLFLFLFLTLGPFICFEIWQMGTLEERSLGSILAGTAGETAAYDQAPSAVPTLPHGRNPSEIAGYDSSCFPNDRL